jgi:PAS domain S-box-containing protein
MAPDRPEPDLSASGQDADDDHVLLSRTARLPPDPRSAAVARRLLREALAEADRAEWIESAELALGEVVANAVLHSHTAFQVRLEIRPASVHVEVQDANPILPIPRDYDVEATTGRGLALVAVLSLECGVRSLGRLGKVVWFDVGAVAEDPDGAEPRLLHPWQAFGPRPSTPDAGAEESVEVHLLGLPPLLWLAARQHHDTLMREMLLLVEKHQVPDIDVVAADQARGTISEGLALGLERLRRSAPTDGSPAFDYRGSQPWMPARIDLFVRVSRSAGATFPALQDTLDTAERLATQGRLLAFPGLPEIVEVRDWVCSQVVLQLAGVAATPWPGSAQVRFETTTRGRTSDALEWDVTVVTESLRGVAAADDANRILAVSPSLAHALGWEVDDLVGRRVVTLIPPSLREAHVAAFTRHLATGAVHVLGQSLRLPVRRKDGTEVLSDFRVERAAYVRGRTIFLAWIEPLH